MFRLAEHDVRASYPHQFIDIGFMSHTKDPSGYTIELLQHEFESNFSWKESEDQKSGVWNLDISRVYALKGENSVCLQYREACRKKGLDDIFPTGSLRFLRTARSL